MRRRSKTRPIDNVRVIRDIMNSNKDYWIPKVRAEELFKEGKLIQIEAYKDKLVYSTRTKDEYYV
jgi:hypothetical protein